MAEHMEATADDIRPLGSRFLIRVFYGFAVLAILSMGVSIGGRWLGQSIVLGGHTDDQTMHEIVIGNNVISAPSNEIRFERSRVNGIASRLDLYFHWPDMSGYSAGARNDFNQMSGTKRIIFASFEPSMMSRDMSGRFEPIYRGLIIGPGSEGPGGTRLFAFDPKSGYVNELLAVAPRAGQQPFVARCLTGSSATESLAPCERDIEIGDGLTLTYRFPGELLGDWKTLEASILKKAGSMVRTGKGPRK